MTSNYDQMLYKVLLEAAALLEAKRRVLVQRADDNEDVTSELRRVAELTFRMDKVAKGFEYWFISDVRVIPLAQGEDSEFPF